MTDTKNLRRDRVQPLLNGRHTSGDFYDEVGRQANGRTG